MHFGVGKMYHDLKEVFWCEGMKRDMFDYVTKSMTCQQVKVKHQRHIGLHQSLKMPIWKWESVTLDFLVELPKT